MIPPLPEGLTVKNRVAGKINVSKHAWERFCQRFKLVINEEDFKKTVVEVYSREMQDCFKRSAVYILPSITRVKNLLKHDFVECDYFYDHPTNLCFIVDKKKQKLITVTTRQQLKTAPEL